MHSNSASHSAKRRVLVVDDERAIADTLALILNNAGYEASATYSGTAAVQLSPVLAPDLVISDVQMPGLDGISAVIQIRASRPETHIMLFSGHPEAHSDRAREHHFEIFAKPLAPEFLLRRIHEQFHGRAEGTHAGC